MFLLCQSLLENFGLQDTEQDKYLLALDIFSLYFYDKFEESDRIILKEKEIDEKDLEGAFCCIMATDDPVVNSRMAGICREKGILVNVVDVKDECDFYFPSVICKENIVIGIGSGGTSPGKVRSVREEIEKAING